MNTSPSTTQINDPSDHVMIDIETLGLQQNAVIISIGAVSLADLSNTFYVELDLHQPERSFDASTLKFWLEQERAGNQIPIGSVYIHDALEMFGMWVRQFANPKVWCKGTDFDIKILAHAFNEHGMAPSWKYNDVRDCRTVFKLLPHDFADTNQTPHNALADAQFQAARLLFVLEAYNLTLA